MRKRVVPIALITALVLSVMGCSTQKISVEESADLKPVIYLYPTEDNTEVTVTLDYNGELDTLIPNYNLINGWQVTADTDGQIRMGDETYDYLFWEGYPHHKYDFFSGFCVKGSDTEAFLNDKLTELGLNDAEKAEFIEFWLPRMENNPYNVISFQDKAYTENAKLTITPEPDSVIRVFMAWYPSDRYIHIVNQYLEEGHREGFTVVEWGGNKVN